MGISSEFEWLTFCAMWKTATKIWTIPKVRVFLQKNRFYESRCSLCVDGMILTVSFFACLEFFKFINLSLIKFERSKTIINFHNFSVLYWDAQLWVQSLIRSFNPIQPKVQRQRFEREVYIDKLQPARMPSNGKSMLTSSVPLNLGVGPLTIIQIELKIWFATEILRRLSSGNDSEDGPP